MIKFFRDHLGARLFLSYLFVILVGAIILGLATQFTVPQAFNQHMGLGQGTGLVSGQGPMFHKAMAMEMGTARARG